MLTEPFRDDMEASESHPSGSLSLTSGDIPFSVLETMIIESVSMQK